MTAERVFAVDRSLLQELPLTPSCLSGIDVERATLVTIENFGRLIDRERAELSDRFIQIIGCLIVVADDKVLCIRRAKASSRNELRLKFSLVFGGHVDASDVCSVDPIEHCAQREAREELGIAFASLQFLGLLWDPATPVGRLHLGCVYVGEVEDAGSGEVVLDKALDRNEFVGATKKTRAAFLTPDDLKAQRVDAFDPWSKILLQSGALDAVLPGENHISVQASLKLDWNAGASSP